MLLCALALAALLIPFGSSSAAAQEPRGFWGLMPIQDPESSEFGRMARGNVETLRLLVVWPDVETAPGVYDWRRLDYFFASSAANGIEVLPFVYGTPAWAGVDCQGLDPEACERVPPLSGAASSAWADFLKAVVARYGPQGSFWSETEDQFDVPYVPLRRVQIWNEPSSQFYWRPKPNPKQYAKLVRASHDAIAAVDPSVEVVLAGLFPKPVNSKKTGYSVFLPKLFGTKKFKKYFDIAAFHPYAGSIKQLRKQIKTMRRLMREGGVRNKPLWITEIGWGSAPPQANRPLIKGIDGQRALLEQSFDLLESKRSSWKLAGLVWYAWRDPGMDFELCLFCSSAGLFDVNGDPKPAWFSYVQNTGGSPE